MDLPYYKQQTRYTCALACLKMVLETFGIKLEEYQLSPLVDYDPDIGVPMPFVARACRVLNLNYKLIRFATLDDLKYFISKKLYPIVLLKVSVYQKVPEVHGHMVVVKNITDKDVIINDPDREFGQENKKVNLNLFLEAWTASKNWLLVIGVDNDK